MSIWHLYDTQLSLCTKARVSENNSGGSCRFVAVITLSINHCHHLVRGHKTGSNNSGVGDKMETEYA